MKKRTMRLGCILLSTVLLGTAALTGCGQTKKNTTDTKKTESSSTKESAKEKKGPEIDGLTYESAMDLEYAEGFQVYYYKDGYKMIDIKDDAKFLVVPENQDVPDGAEEDYVILQQPLDHIYLAATSAMALFNAIDSLDNITMTGTQASGWYIENAVKAMDDGKIKFAGKYSEPDYEMLVDEDCDLAIESTMILHTPKVQEMIESLDIPVMIDRSSYESHPLGRTEWIKLYAAMLNKEDAADAFFEKQVENVDALKDFKNTEKTVAFFYVSSDGTVVVRRSDDYIPKMIELSGGRYVFDDLTGDDSNTSAVKLTMEEFYAQAADADYLIYNSSIDNPINSVKDLEEQDALFSDFKAVKEGNVWCTGKYLYQATDIVGELITDMNLMLTGGDESKMTFLYHVK